MLNIVFMKRVQLGNLKLAVANNIYTWGICMDSPNLLTIKAKPTVLQQRKKNSLFDQLKYGTCTGF